MGDPPPTIIKEDEDEDVGIGSTWARVYSILLCTTQGGSYCCASRHYFCSVVSRARARTNFVCCAGIVVSRHIYLPAFFLRSLRVREFKIHGILLPKSTLYDKAFLTRCLLWGVKNVFISGALLPASRQFPTVRRLTYVRVSSTAYCAYALVP
jgi:hypothetical protein